jgi:uncharacterized protein (TIGR03067 family)
MTNIFVRVATVAFLFAVSVSFAKAADKDSLQGSWNVESATHAGEAMPVEVRGKMTLEFKGDKVVAHSPNRPEDPAEFVLDSSKSPKTITIKPPKGEKELHGIYKLDGDSLTICMTEGSELPTKFESPKGSQIALLVLKREKK